MQIQTKIGNLFVQIKNSQTMPVLFLSGLGDFSTPDNYKLVINHLPDTIGYITIDLPCSGKSEYINQANFTIADYVKTIETILNNFEVNEFVICAHSISGLLALYLNKALKTNCRGLVLIEPTTQSILFGQLAKKPYPQLIELEAQIAAYENPFGYLASLISKSFKASEAKIFWQNTFQAVEKHQACLNVPAFSATPTLRNEDFNIQVRPDIKVIIFTQAFREQEYQQSEYFNTHTKLVLAGSSHYLQWELAIEIANTIHLLTIANC